MGKVRKWLFARWLSNHSGGSGFPMEAEWFYSEHGQQAGPCTAIQLRELVQSGRVLAQDLVWKQGMSEWIPVASIPGLARFLPPASETGMTAGRSPHHGPEQAFAGEDDHPRPRGRVSREEEYDEEEHDRPRRRKNMRDDD